MAFPPLLRSWIAASALLILSGPVAWAADTAPTLTLTGADALRSAAGVLVRLEGSYPQADLVQNPMKIQLLVRELAQGTEFIRFELPTGAYGGILESLAPGLSAANVEEVLTWTAPQSGARLVALRPGHIEVLLPPDFPAGAAEAQLFFVYVDDPMFSNPLAFQVPAPPEPLP